VRVIHLPHNNYNVGVQYVALEDFTKNILFQSEITHVAHIDIDEFIVLKKHRNISDFISEYIVGDCQGIAMNWRHFGSSRRTEKTDEPNTVRFTMCERVGNKHIKTLFKKEHFQSFDTVHAVHFKKGFTKTTNNHVVTGPFNSNIDFSVIQLNHYKSKTLPEFRTIRTRNRADVAGGYVPENVDESFRAKDLNEIDDFTAHDFYKTHCQ
jgi:hypothetical protein